MNTATIKQNNKRKLLPAAATILLTFAGISHAEDISVIEKTHKTNVNQVKFDTDRTQKLQSVFESIQHGNKTELASCLPGLSEEEAAKILKIISERWGDTSKFLKEEIDPGVKLDKGKMKELVHWGSDSTQIGRWFSLRSPEAKGKVMRIGLLFFKASSEARQFLAVEWEALGVAPNEKPHGIKQ